MEIWLVVIINGVKENGFIMNVRELQPLLKENGIVEIVNQIRKKIIRSHDDINPKFYLKSI